MSTLLTSAKIAEFSRSQAETVLIADPTPREVFEMKEFIISSRLNIISVEAVDVSDHSLVTDVLYEYVFANGQDATLFRLKWKK